MWQIEHQCPQCGAPVTLQETDHLLTCPFCRTRLYLITGQHPSYCLPSAVSDAADLLYIPYWRFKGLVFTCTDSGTATKVMDTSTVAAHLKWMPSSLGVRPQAMKLRFITPHTQGTLFMPQLSVNDLLKRIEEQFDAALRTPLLYRAFIGETASTIFAPVFMRSGSAFDAILDRPLAKVTENEFTALKQFEQTKDLQVKFIACLCPACGMDLDGEKESMVLLCRNCGSAWRSSASGLEQIAYTVLPGNDTQGDYLPFWKIKARVDGIELKSRADFMRLTNAAQLIKRQWEEREFYFWSPAFKVSPEPFLRLSQGMTMVQPEAAEMQDIPQSAFHPVTLPVQESAESLKVVLAESAIPKKNFLQKLPEISIQIESFKLAYVPFQSSASEFINPQMSLSINKNTLMFGANL
jgi:DNA-directed RNA polymerase subunit RPC12/RpoP